MERHTGSGGGHYEFFEDDEQESTKRVDLI
jgi:hypothetical protein